MPTYSDPVLAFSILNSFFIINFLAACLNRNVMLYDFDMGINMQNILLIDYNIIILSLLLLLL
jgi:hypothetical protein